MKLEERIAKEYFIHNGYCDVIYEPDGKKPPDFLLNKLIAVEVRRLNQHYNNINEIEPLEKLEFTLIPKIKNLLLKFDHYYTEYSAYISVSYRRPIILNKQIFQEIENILSSHIKNINQRRVYEIREGLIIDIFPTQKKLNKVYRLGFHSDDDSGGMVIEKIYQNMIIAIKEKERKIDPVRSNYKTWWLALVDFIGFGFIENEIDDLHNLPRIEHNFDKILLISPTNPSYGESY